MKTKYKIIIFLLCISAFLMVFTCAYANDLPVSKPDNLSCFFQIKQNEEKDTEFQGTLFNLPASLTIIGESAFEGTSLETVNLPEKVERIEDNAFANIPALKTITILNSVTYIGRDTFKGSNQVRITAAPQSYARAYAQENQIPFHPITSYYAFTPSSQITSISNSRNELQKMILEGETTDKRKANQTGRMTGDLNADRYEGVTSFHIQGRSPPMG